jgi:hypothetical protein
LRDSRTEARAFLDELTERVYSTPLSAVTMTDPVEHEECRRLLELLRTRFRPTPI